MIGEKGDNTGPAIVLGLLIGAGIFWSTVTALIGLNLAGVI